MGAAVLLVACLGMPAAPAAAVGDPVQPQLTVAPDASVAGLPVVVDGSCPPAPDTTVTWADGGTAVKLDEDGAFAAPVVVDVPAGTEPGRYPVTSGCGGEAAYEVLAAPVLEVVPAEAVPGQVVLATGTCPAPPGPVEVLLDGEGTVVDQLPDGRIGDVALLVPGDAAAGEHAVTTSCGARDTVRVSVPEEPGRPGGTEVPGDPGGPVPVELVPVPVLDGLTAGQAATVVAAGGLVLEGSGTGRVTGQDPAAGSLVPAGSVVSVELGEPGFPLLPAAAGGGGLLVLLLAAAPLSLHRRRLRRERRWVDRDVRVLPGGREPLPAAPPPGPVPGLDVRIGVHRHRWPPEPGGPPP